MAELNGLSECESAVMEKTESEQMGSSSSFKKFIFPPPLRIPATQRPPLLLGGDGSSNGLYGDEFVSLGSSGINAFRVWLFASSSDDEDDTGEVKAPSSALDCLTELENSLPLKGVSLGYSPGGEIRRRGVLSRVTGSDLKRLLSDLESRKGYHINIVTVRKLTLTQRRRGYPAAEVP
ncbi:hypothetical protein CASFOL_025292 [Castilleja foliolosa]|uniref:Uncharacterized protein n=1 Tax=Castilleja foliolosa TaxID=1961234 RepID=A0ABD3CQQ3_9LAMI